MGRMVAIYYDYDLNDNYGSTNSETLIITFGSSRSYSSTHVELPPDEVELEKVQICPWLFLLPEDQRDPVVRRPTVRPPRRPARCRDPPG